ncbi:MAG: iron-sulfur cluster assembly accessory protein [Sphingobacteriales bacterium]|jgi:iron-sulfur cluster assembly protein|nr:iron-sulfur cluster assembly accessory protein [Sphingobacteriales bacterium]
METEAKQSTFTPVTLTENAIKAVKQLLSEKELEADFGLRIGVNGGGCSGMTYVLGFDKKQDNDQEFYIDEVKIYVNKSHGLYLLGTEVDYQDGLNSRGFTFSNPNATSTCGCGSSFSA